MGEFCINPIERQPGAIYVHVTRVADATTDRRVLEDKIEIVETTVAEIGALLARLGASPDEPATITIEVVADIGTIHLSAEDQRAFAESILNPPEPTPALQRAIARYRAIARNSE